MELFLEKTEFILILELMDDFGCGLVLALVAHTKCPQSAHSMLKERYIGSYDSYQEYVDQVVDQALEQVAEFRYYFDYERFGRDMKYDLDVFTLEDGVAIFHRHR